MTLSDLISKLEGVTEGSRELDCQIGYAVDLIAEGGLSWRTSVDHAGWIQAIKRADSHQNVWSSYLPRYSTSVDAALTLVPENGFWSVTVKGEGTGFEAFVRATPSMDRMEWSPGATAPLAIVLASLKSRSV